MTSKLAPCIAAPRRPSRIRPPTGGGGPPAPPQPKGTQPLARGQKTMPNHAGDGKFLPAGEQASSWPKGEPTWATNGSDRMKRGATHEARGIFQRESIASLLPFKRRGGMEVNVSMRLPPPARCSQSQPRSQSAPVWRALVARVGPPHNQGRLISRLGHHAFKRGPRRWRPALRVAKSEAGAERLGKCWSAISSAGPGEARWGRLQPDSGSLGPSPTGPAIPGAAGRPAGRRIGTPSGPEAGAAWGGRRIGSRGLLGTWWRCGE